MSSSDRAHFFSRIEDLPKMLLWIRKHLIDAEMDAASIQKLELASEEAIVNVIRHAYEDRGGRIELAFKEIGGGVEIAIVDCGPPFNPLLSAPSVDLEAPLEKRKEGGLGLFLLRNCVDEVLYRREGASNILTLVKRFSRTR